MLVSAKEMLDKAVAGHYAVGQFNINNLEWTKSILLTAEELKSPVILGVSEGAGKYMTGFKTVAAVSYTHLRFLPACCLRRQDHGYAFGLPLLKLSPQMKKILKESIKSIE